MKTPDFKPILFNTEMVKAILEGRKTQTRRLVKQPPVYGDILHDDKGWYYEDGTRNGQSLIPPYDRGDNLWVRETWANPSYAEVFDGADPNMFIYKADEPLFPAAHGRWHPSIHMPKEAARIFLRVNDVRVERLQNIGNADAIFEGFSGTPCEHECANPALGCTDCLNTGWLEPPYAEFAQLWDTTIKPADRDRYGWDANPWVWVLEFERCKKPEGWCEY